MAEVCEITLIHEEKVDRSIRRLNSVDLKETIELYKALADEKRLKILISLIHESELCVCDLANIIDASVATTSHHLQLLRKLKIIKQRKEGKLSYYSVLNQKVHQLIECGRTNE